VCMSALQQFVVFAEARTQHPLTAVCSNTMLRKGNFCHVCSSNSLMLIIWWMSSSKNCRVQTAARLRQPWLQDSALCEVQGCDCPELEGQIFNCSDCKQVDNCIHALKQISKFVGAECEHGGDIHSSIIDEAKVTIAMLATPAHSTRTSILLRQPMKTVSWICI